jgi:two-component system cell cycle sensor histidine kinase/response regulator CckA
VTILVVDDNASVRALVRRILEAEGHRVLEAASGAEALDIAERHGGGIDLLLTDVKMPGMGGVELVEKVVESRPSLRALYISGDRELEESQELRGGVEFVAKPFSPADLLRSVQRALAPHAHA